ncbi:hypothetical protein GCM10027400_09060 [Pseudoxanthomonas daejeonensis]
MIVVAVSVTPGLRSVRVMLLAARAAAGSAPQVASRAIVRRFGFSACAGVFARLPWRDVREGPLLFMASIPVSRA